MPINQATKPYTFVNGPGEFADAAQVNACFDTLYSKLNELVDAINLAAGLKANLDARLDLTINEDGTARSGTTFGGEWINPALAATFVDASNFTVEGDQTSLFLQYRRLKITLAASTVYTEIAAVSYSGVSGLTTVTVADAVLTNPLTAVEHAAYSPQASGKHSISPNALTPTNATNATNATIAATATNALALNGQADTFYRNADNLNAGTLPAARFNDTAHGNRAGGTLHAAATTGAAGFMAAADKIKLDNIYVGRILPTGVAEIPLPAGWTSEYVNSTYYIRSNVADKYLYLLPVPSALDVHVKGASFNAGYAAIVFRDNASISVATAFYFVAILV